MKWCSGKDATKFLTTFLKNSFEIFTCILSLIVLPFLLLKTFKVISKQKYGNTKALWKKRKQRTLPKQIIIHKRYPQPPLSVIIGAKVNIFI